MTPELRRVGYFAELRHGDRDGPRLRDLVTPEPQLNESDLVGYLRGGAALAVAAGQMVGDVLDERSSPIAELAIQTDGTWTWPSDLAYYVETYHVPLPSEFIRHVAAASWMPPVVDREQLDRLAERARGDDRAS